MLEANTLIQLNIKRVLNCRLYDEPKLLIICADSTKNNLFFWHCVITKKCNRIDFDNPIVGDIAQVKITRDPFEVNYTYKTLESGKKICYALVVGLCDGSSVLCLLNIDSSSNINISFKYFDQDNNVGHVTSIYILPQDADDKRMGHHDPQILLGYSKGAIRIYRFRAIIYSFRASRLRSPVDLSEFTEYPGYPITHLSCARTYNSLKFIISFAQENPNDSAFGNTQTYVKLIEFNGSQRSMLKLIHPPSPSSLITETHLMPHYQDNVDFTVVFYSPLSRVYTISVWHMDSKKTIKNMLEKQIDETTCIEQLDSPKHISSDTIQYLLKNPEKIIELAFPLQSVGLKRKATVDFYKESLEAIEQPNKRTLPKAERPSGEPSEEEEMSVSQMNTDKSKEEEMCTFLNEGFVQYDEPEDINSDEEKNTQDPFVWVENPSVPIKLDTMVDPDNHLSDQEDFLNSDEDLGQNEIVSLRSLNESSVENIDESPKETTETMADDDSLGNSAFDIPTIKDETEEIEADHLDTISDSTQSEGTEINEQEHTDQPSEHTLDNKEEADHNPELNSKTSSDFDPLLQDKFSHIAENENDLISEGKEVLSTAISIVDVLKEATAIETVIVLTEETPIEEHPQEFLETSVNTKDEESFFLVQDTQESIAKFSEKERQDESMTASQETALKPFRVEGQEEMPKNSEAEIQEETSEKPVTENHLDIHTESISRAQDEVSTDRIKETEEKVADYVADSLKDEGSQESLKNLKVASLEKLVEETPEAFLMNSDTVPEALIEMEETNSPTYNEGSLNIKHTQHSSDEPMSLDHNDAWMEVDSIEGNTDEPMEEEDSFMLIDSSFAAVENSNDNDEDMLDDKSSDKQDHENEYSVLVENEIEEREQEYGDEKEMDIGYTGDLDQSWASVFEESNDNTEVDIPSHEELQMVDPDSKLDQSDDQKTNGIEGDEPSTSRSIEENGSNQIDQNTEPLLDKSKASIDEETGNDTYFELPEYHEVTVEKNKSAEVSPSKQSSIYFNPPEYEEDSREADSKDEPEHENSEETMHFNEKEKAHIAEANLVNNDIPDKDTTNSSSKNLLDYDEFYDAIGESQETENEPNYTNDTLKHRESEENEDEFVDYQEDQIKEDYDEYLDAEGGFDQIEEGKMEGEKEEEDYISFEDTPNQSQNLSVTDETYPEYEEEIDDGYPVEDDKNYGSLKKEDQKEDKDELDVAYSMEEEDEQNESKYKITSSAEEDGEGESEEGYNVYSMDEEGEENESKYNIVSSAEEDEEDEEKENEEERNIAHSMDEEGEENENKYNIVSSAEEDEEGENEKEHKTVYSTDEDSQCEEDEDEDEDEDGNTTYPIDVEEKGSYIPINYNYSNDEANSGAGSAEEYSRGSQNDAIDLISDTDDDELSCSQESPQPSKKTSPTLHDSQNIESMGSCESASLLAKLVASYNVDYYNWGRKKLQ
ncbi:hypothetical protein BY458DRAFT_514175 [Sporodiniella umbellata]|nr:hypothetical protein BY458DRAFT_514175 [Sporodiniella umbellata]